MNRKFNRHKRKPEAVDVDITSLLDILTILLVFLLKSYNASDLKLDLVKNLDMPDSDAREMTRFAPVVQVNKAGMIYLNNRELGRLPASESVLTARLKVEKDRIEAENKAGRKVNTELLNLVFDKNMDYEIVQKIMHQSALAGYSQFKFIVRANY
jgi:biopolymer transport protein ExbD